MLQKEKEAERGQQRQAQDPDAPFTGSLASKNKPDLQEIAAALNLSEDGTKDALTQRINVFFNSNPLLHDEPRFSGLFHHALQRCTQTNDQNDHPMVSISESSTSPHDMRHPLSTNIVNILPNLPLAGLPYASVQPFLFHPPAGTTNIPLPSQLSSIHSTIVPNFHSTFHNNS